MRKKTASLDEYLVERLKDPAEAAAYLNAALEEGDRASFLLALRRVSQAHGGVSVVARQAGISREHLSRMLSGRGNPEMKSLSAVLHGMDLKLSVQPV